MKQLDLFLASDSALRSVIDRLTRADLERAAPADWSRKPDQTVRDTVAAHARDEAWIPDLVAGRTMDEVGESWNGDLLGDDPIGSYDRINDAATAATRAELDPDQVAHLSYGDFPLSEGLIHMSLYRAFQAWSIAKFVGQPFHFAPHLLELMHEIVMPRADDWRAIHVFSPAIEPPAGADAETLLLCEAGYWRP
ncbi:hypothetical protein BH09ACT4_BH09ACT4_14050 [soil metagenome]